MELSFQTDTPEVFLEQLFTLTVCAGPRAGVDGTTRGRLPRSKCSPKPPYFCVKYNAFFPPRWHLLHSPTARLCLIESLVGLFDADLDYFTAHIRLTVDLPGRKGTRSSCLSSL